MQKQFFFLDEAYCEGEGEWPVYTRCLEGNIRLSAIASRGMRERERLEKELDDLEDPSNIRVFLVEGRASICLEPVWGCVLLSCSPTLEVIQVDSRKARDGTTSI